MQLNVGSVMKATKSTTLGQPTTTSLAIPAVPYFQHIAHATHAGAIGDPLVAVMGSGSKNTTGAHYNTPRPNFYSYPHLKSKGG